MPPDRDTPRRPDDPSERTRHAPPPPAPGGDASRRPNDLPATSRQRLGLAELAASLGDPEAADGKRPVWLDAGGSVWFVERGALDVFLVRVWDGVPEAPFRHVLRLRPGRFAFGAQDAGEFRLLARGLPDTVVRRIPVAALVAASADDADGAERALVEDADDWVAGILATIAADIDIRPRPDMALGESPAARLSGVLTSATGVLWIDGGAADLFGSEEPEPGELVPIAPQAWAVTRRPAEAAIRSSRALGAGLLLDRALPGFHRLAFAAEALNHRLSLADQANLQMARSTWRRRDEADARRRLFGLLAPSPPRVSGDDALLAALRAVGRHEGIAIRAPTAPPGQAPTLADALHASGVRARQVSLSPEDRWWRGDSGAILAFRRKDGGPVALLPGPAGRYRLHDPATGAVSPVGRAEAASLDPDACVLYRPLPSDRPVGMRTLLAAAIGKARGDVLRVVGAGAAAAVLALAPAAGIGVLIGNVLPSRDSGALLELALLLVLLALAAALFHVLRGAALMRIEARFAARATAALWDRLLRLPERFHRRYSSGELTAMALAFQTVRDRIAGAAGAALLSAMFLLPSISLVFLYDVMLGWVSLGIGLAALALTLGLGAAQISAQRRKLREERRLAGHLSQLVGSIRKLQATGAEGSARASWARRYRRQKLAEIRIGVLNDHLKAFGAAVPLLAAAALFAVAAMRGDALGVGEFLVAYVASMIFHASIVTLGTALEALAAVAPTAEQARPILAAVPDSANRRGPPVMLAGGLRFESVSFRYADDGPLVLDRVSLEARPGEFIAIAGESGAGKSTLIRLALGLETPTGGAVYYDDRDLAYLDPIQVRRQVGTVLQDGGTRMGTVRDNIIGLDPSMTLDDAWRAARQSVVDRDIARMPMQMHTSMGERAAAVSGGQSQRIRIAQALVRNPRFLLLDEATNWLDRRSQSALMEGIRNSTATRIVIAHRISTIRHAHRIYVLEAGKVVQVGSFDELAGRDGPFRTLVRRQML